MWQLYRVALLLLTVCGLCVAAADAESSRQILPKTFKPPQVFKNTNLVRNTNLEKGYIKESINVVIENVDSSPQSEYYIPFDADTIGKVGGIEVRDKKDATKPAFKVELTEWEIERYQLSGSSFTYQTDPSAQPNSTAYPLRSPSPPNPSKPSK